MRETKKKQREREKARGVAAVDGGGGYSGGFCSPRPLFYFICFAATGGEGAVVR